MTSFFLLLLIGMVTLFFRKRNMFWCLLNVLAMTWLLVSTAIGASFLVTAFADWMRGVWT